MKDQQKNNRFHETDQLTIHVITLSDRAAAGTYEDRSGPVIRDMTMEYFTEQGRRIYLDHSLIPDDGGKLAQILSGLCNDGVDIVITSGGTGVGPRDIAPETIRPMLDKEITGIMEYIRVTSGKKNLNALISRSVAGTIGTTQVYSLPGSVKAVREYMDIILKVVEHVYEMIHGIDSH